MADAQQFSGAGSGDWPLCIAAIAKGRDKQAFAALFSHFAPRVKSYLLRCRLDAALAEELAQETLLTVWRKAATFDPQRAAVSTWIFTIARNLRFDAVKGAPHPDAIEEYPLLESLDPLPADALLTSEREEKTRRALTDLPEDQAEVVRLSFFEDKPHSEIAAQLGIPLGTVKSRLRLAFARLKTSLEGVA
jgi:RNA polymerase sigma-70 factor (ECF subfamily)